MLVQAINYCHLDIIKYTIENGADIARAIEICSLGAPIKRGCIDITKYIFSIMNVYDVNRHCYDLSRTIPYALQYDIDTVKYLYEVLPRDLINDKRALSCAANTGNKDTFNYVYEMSDINNIDEETKTCILKYSFNHSVDYINFIIKKIFNLEKFPYGFIKYMKNTISQRNKPADWE